MEKILLALMLLVLSVPTSVASAKESTLRVLTWPGYFSSEFVRTFEKEHHIKVELTHFSSDAMRDAILYDKRYLHSFDLVLLSAAVAKDYVVDGLLTPLDKSLITHLSELSSPVKRSKTSRDHVALLSYSLLGVAYDDEAVPAPDSWRTVFDTTSGQIGRLDVPDDTNDAMDAALMSVGASIRGFSESELIDAAEKISAVASLNGINYDDKGLRDFFNNGGVYSVLHSSDAARLLSDMPNIKFIYPGNVTRIWRDYIGIHRSTTNVLGAHKFINFSISPRGAELLAKSHFNAVTQPAAVKQLELNKHPSFTSGFVYPNKDVWINVTYHNNPWMDVKKSFLYERIRNATPKT
jgi:spermidine/putrescine transport system substrate-binding protein